MRVTVEVLSGTRQGDAQVFDVVEAVTLGRDPANSFVFPPDDERAVSANHARLVIRNSRLILEDLGSTNGTYVDGIRISSPTAVGQSNVVSLGKSGPRLKITTSVPKTIVEIPGTIVESSSDSSRLEPPAADGASSSPARSAVGSQTVLRMIDSALESAQKSGRLPRVTIFAQEIVSRAVKESRRELKIAFGVAALVLIAAFGIVFYRIAAVRSEIRVAKGELVTEYEKGLDAITRKLSEQAKEIEHRKSMYESTASGLRGEMEKLTGGQNRQNAKVRDLFRQLDESRGRYVQLVEQLEQQRIEKARAGTAVPEVNEQANAKSTQVANAVRDEQRRQDQLIGQIASSANQNSDAVNTKAVEQLTHLGAEVRAADAVAAQLGAAAANLQVQQKQLVASKAEDTSNLQRAMKDDAQGVAAVLDRLTKLDKAAAPVVAAPTPVTVLAAEDAPRQVAKRTLSKPYPRASLKKRIALGKFECLVAQNPWGLSREDLEKQMRAQMTTLLSDSGKFIIVEREDLREVLNEQRLAKTGVTSSQTSSQPAQLLGVQALLIGKITQLDEQVLQTKSSFNWGAMLNAVASAAGQYSPNTQFAQASSRLASDPTVGTLQTTTEHRNSKFTIHIDFKVLDTNTGEVLFTTQGHGVAETQQKRTAIGTAYVQGATGLLKGNDNLADGTRMALYDATVKIIDGIEGRPWQGRVMDRSGEQIVLNAGADAGLKEGDTFQVLSRGKELVDPDSGQIRGYVQTPAGTVRVVHVSDVKSETEVLDQTIAFKPGDDLIYLGMTKDLSSGTPASTEPEERTPFTYAVISAARAYTGPGINYGQVDLDLENGSPVRVKIALGDWAKVILPSGAMAWMPRETLSLHEDYPTTIRQVVVSVNKAALRQNPSNRARKMDVLRQGAVAGVQEKLGNWYLVKAAQGASGWISETEVRPAEGAQIPAIPSKA